MKVSFRPLVLANNKTALSCALLFAFSLLHAQVWGQVSDTVNASLPSNSCQADTTNLRIGLVLGGGGAKGAAAVGALKVIEEAGIPIHCIAGTSIGAIVGGLYACGYRSNQLDSLFRSQDWLSLLFDRSEQEKSSLFSERDGVTYVLGFPVSRRHVKDHAKNPPPSKDGRKGTSSKGQEGAVGLLNGNRVETLLDSMITHSPNLPPSAAVGAGETKTFDSFDSLPIPFRCVATDIHSLEDITLSSGSLAKAMRASMAIPGAYKPVRMDGHTLVDGGVINNLPVDVAKQMGADIIIAIDLTQEQHETRDFSLKDLLGIGGVIDWLVSRPDWKRYNDNRQMADVCIHPQLGSYGPASFNATAISDMIQRGEKCAREHWRELMAIKARLKLAIH